MSIVTALCLLTMLPWLCAAAFIYGQDGFDFSGAIRANPIVSDVTMTAYGSWPAAVSNIGNDAFAGGVFDGESVWLVPFNADAVVRVNVSDGGMAAFNGWPSDVDYAFGGGAFDGVSIWMGPFNADVVVRVYTGSGDMTAYAWPTAFSNFSSPPYGCQAAPPLGHSTAPSTPQRRRTHLQRTIRTTLPGWATGRTPPSTRRSR